MKRILLPTVLVVLASGTYAQDINVKNAVPVPSNGVAGGANASVWSARCKEGMVMTGIEIVVGGTCRNQCNADGRPLAAYRILCSQIEGRKATRMHYSESVVAAPLLPNEAAIIQSVWKSPTK